MRESARNHAGMQDTPFHERTREPVIERTLRKIVRHLSWAEQGRAWRELCASV